MMQLGRQWTTVMIAGLGTIVLLLTARPSLGQGCTGDCDASDEVTIDDILKMVNIAQGTGSADDCMAGDPDNSGEITIDEILQAVNNAQTGCSSVPTSTPTGQATPTPTGPTPTPTETPTLGVLGTKHFVLDPRNSQFRAAISAGFVIPVGGFRGQTNGVVGDAYIDFEVGQPNAQGLATVNITGSSEYLVVDGSGIAQVVLCIKPMLPVRSAGTIDCKGGTLDFSIETSIDHNIGQLGVDGFTAEACTTAGGQIESPNQVCATGTVGEECAANVDCDSTAGAADGTCGLSDATCTVGKVGQPCRNDIQCDTSAAQPDGTCGNPTVHPGVCNGPVQFGLAGVTNRPGEMTIAPVAQAGLNGLPVELSIETATPCGDEGPGLVQPFAMTTGVSRTTLLHFNNSEDDFPFTQTGFNFDCRNWQNSPGRFVLSFGALHTFMGSDVITGFEFGTANSNPTATPMPTRTPTAGS